MAADDEKRDPNQRDPNPPENERPGDRTPEERAPEEPGPDDGFQGSPADPDIIDETGAVEEAPVPPDEPLDALSDEPLDETPEEVVEEEPTVPAAEFEALRRERDGYMDAMLRQKADFENARKRHDRERERILEAASEKLVRELLPVLDNLDRALESSGDIRGGVQATRDQLSDVLGGEGLLPIASDGQPFDPNVHEAVMGQPSDEHEEGTVLQTFQKGYLLNGRAVRPAKVVVAKQV